MTSATKWMVLFFPCFLMMCTPAPNPNPSVDKMDSASAITYRNQADEFFRKSDLEQAIKLYSRALELDPQDAKAYMMRGVCQAFQNNEDRAIDDFTHALEINPREVAAYKYRGQMYNAKEKYDLGIKDFTRALEIDPQDAEAYNFRGSAHGMKGEHDLAIQDFNQALQIDDKYALAYFNRGTEHISVAAYELAVRDFKSSIQFDADLVVAYDNLAWLYATCPQASIRNGKEAIKIATQVCEITGWNEADPINVLAAAYAETGEFKKAIMYQQRAIEMANSEKEKEEFIARLKLYQAGKPSRAQ